MGLQGKNPWAKLIVLWILLTERSADKKQSQHNVRKNQNYSMDVIKFLLSTYILYQESFHIDIQTWIQSFQFHWQELSRKDLTSVDKGNSLNQATFFQEK